MQELLNHKTVLITGATSGIGLAVAEKAAFLGAKVIGIGRSMDKIEAAKARIEEFAPNGSVSFLQTDLSSQQAVHQLAREVERNHLNKGSSGQLDRLVLNAASVPFWQELTPEGFDHQWAVNYLSGFLLAHKLRGAMSKAVDPRIISVSSGSHYHTKLHWEDIQLFKRYNPLLAYKQTKLAQVIFTVEFNRRQYGINNIRAFAADPGLVSTDIGLKGKSRLMKFFWKLRRLSGISPEKAAEGIIFLLCESSIQSSDQPYWKHGKWIPPNPIALDISTGKRLWELSEKLCGVH